MIGNGGEELRGLVGTGQARGDHRGEETPASNHYSGSLAAI